MKISAIENEPGSFAFFCPGCKERHQITTPPWTFNGDFEKPTIRNSVLVRSGHYVDGRVDGHCWCTHNAEQTAKGEEPSGFECSLCHSFVTDGRIEFLNDSTHALAGQTVGLPDFFNDAE